MRVIFKMFIVSSSGFLSSPIELSTKIAKYCIKSCKSGAEPQEGLLRDHVNYRAALGLIATLHQALPELALQLVGCVGGPGAGSAGRRLRGEVILYVNCRSLRTVLSGGRTLDTAEEGPGYLE